MKDGLLYYKSLISTSNQKMVLHMKGILTFQRSRMLITDTNLPTMGKFRGKIPRNLVDLSHISEGISESENERDESMAVHNSDSKNHKNATILKLTRTLRHSIVPNRVTSQKTVTHRHLHILTIRHHLMHCLAKIGR